MSVPRKTPSPAPQGLIVLGKITNLEGKNPQGGEHNRARIEAWRAGYARVWRVVMDYGQWR